MLLETKAIVLHKLKYSDNSIIVKYFTQEAGVQTCMVKGYNSKKNGNKVSSFLPLTVANIIIYKKENRGLHFLKDTKTLYSPSSHNFNPINNSILFFVLELLSNVIKEENPTNDMFQFVEDIITNHQNNYIDDKKWHLHYLLLNLSKHLGLFPLNNYSSECCTFNLQEGNFNNQTISSHIAVFEPLSKILSMLLSNNNIELNVSKQDRAKLLDKLLDYLMYHIDGFKPLKSVEILKTILND